MQSPKNFVQSALARADVKINGNRPWDIKVNNKSFYKRLLSKGSLGLGESYMDGWWECKNLDQFFYKILSAGLDHEIKIDWNLIYLVLKSKLINMQKKSRAFHVGKRHYDVGNDLYRQMLDKRMVYSCGYWKNTKNFDKAQEAKLELSCKKLNLEPGMRILDIGCGWGSFVKYAAEKYNIEAVGITVSKEQAKLGRELCKGLPIEIRVQDYRDVNEKFDRVVSFGMFEHVGYKNYRTFMKVVYRCLKEGRLFLLETTGRNTSVVSAEPWVNKYIFPNGMLPSIKQIADSIEGLFVMEDLHNFGPDHDKTLLWWCRNFDKKWDKIKSGYDERFYRMWRYYLLSFAGGYRVRRLQLWHIVMSKKGIQGGYTSIR